jgi:hypothetical protein
MRSVVQMVFPDTSYGGGGVRSDASISCRAFAIADTADLDCGVWQVYSRVIQKRFHSRSGVF